MLRELINCPNWHNTITDGVDIESTNFFIHLFYFIHNLYWSWKVVVAYL